MTDISLYRDDFLRHMAPPLADHYKRWYPYCRETVLAFIDRFVERESLQHHLQQRLSDSSYENVRRAWYEPFRSYHTRSGKLLRPYLVCLCMQAYGRDPRDAAFVVAIVEVIHAASLMLDDIADNSPLRRGGPTAQRQVGLRVAGVGASAWINCCFALLDSADCGLPQQTRAAMAETIAWEHWVTGMGTTVDTGWPWLGRFDRTTDEYLQSVVHRSTAYTYRLPLKLGALAGGASADETAKLAAFGESLGLAFQIVDDILNVRPSDEYWGKALAEDITQGKITLQVLLTLERAEDTQCRRLIDILRSRTEDSEVLLEAVDIIESSGALVAAREVASRYVAETKEIARSMTFLGAPDRTRLEALVDYIVTRSR